MPHAYWCLLFNFEILAEVFQTDAQVRKALREKTKTKKREREMRRSFGKKEHDAPKCVQGKKERKKWGAESSLLFFSRLLKPFFKGVSIYILLPAGVSSNNVYYMLPRGKSPSRFSHQGAIFTSFRCDLRARADKKKKKMCRKGHSTTLTKQPFSISVLCYSNHCSHVRSIFNVWKKKKKKGVYVTWFPLSVCGWL